jgi:hypothetical protein
VPLSGPPDTNFKRLSRVDAAIYYGSVARHGLTGADAADRPQAFFNRGEITLHLVTFLSAQNHSELSFVDRV